MIKHFTIHDLNCNRYPDTEYRCSKEWEREWHDDVKHFIHKQATTALKEITHKNIEQDSYRIGLDEGCRNAIKLLKGEKP